jgi:hypothetical protein
MLVNEKGEFRCRKTPKFLFGEPSTGKGNIRFYAIAPQFKNTIIFLDC